VTIPLDNVSAVWMIQIAELMFVTLTTSNVLVAYLVTTAVAAPCAKLTLKNVSPVLKIPTALVVSSV
jgi:hypothetical protein